MTTEDAKIVPEGYELVAVKGLGDLCYWLNRCEDKGHLENCYDLIEPWAAFDWLKKPGADALAALTLVQAERDAALVDAQSWRQQADSRTADAVRFGAERDAMQQERDELRAALELMLNAHTEAAGMTPEIIANDVDFGDFMRVCEQKVDFAVAAARAALTPKATQPTSEASRGR